MSTKTLGGTQIRCMLPEGLWYVDTDETEKYIDFADCFENYCKKYLNPEALAERKQASGMSESDMEDFILHVKSTRRIADRNVMTLPFADGPYIEFYTTPPIRFKFETKDDLWQLRNLIEHSGWRTFDLS